MASLEEKLNLSAQEKELVAAGASVGAGCQPCVSHHLKAGASAGLGDEQLLAAVASAERVTAEAAVLMGDHVRGKLGSDVTPALLSRVEETLASLGAALGANDKTNIERTLKAALELGVSSGQLREAIETARVVQENAARIHVREAQRLLETLDVKASLDEGCGCGGADDESAKTHEKPQAASEASAGTGGCEPEVGATGPGGFASLMAAFCGPSGERRATESAAAMMQRCRGMVEGGPEPAPAATSADTAATRESGESCGEGC